MVKSKTKPDVLGLGVEILNQLGQIDERDLLTSWMAEYLGEKISEVKRARGKQRGEKQKECAELILKLWDRRHQLPDGARPLESFEPLFIALHELSQNKPRDSLFRHLPPISKSSEVGKIIQDALAIDKSASTLIRYLLAEAVAKIPNNDKRWTEIRTEVRPPVFDVMILRLLTKDAEDLFDKQANLEKQQQEKLETMLRSIEYFEKSTTHLRALLEGKLKLVK